MNAVVTPESVKQMPFRYRWSDAWLLAAIAHASLDGPAELKHIVGKADWLNHCFMTDGEFESGLVRLTAGNWIREVDGLFETTEAFRHAFGPVEMDSVLRIQADFRKFLDTDWYETLPDPENNLTYPGFSSERLAKAERKYVRDAWKALRKSREQEE